jgi:hypothetical protein
MSRECFDNHKTNKTGKKTVCQKRNCDVCNKLITDKKNECLKLFCSLCQQKREIGHFCFVQPLKKELHRSEKVLFVFYEFETTKDTRFSENATEHFRNLVCVQ